MASIENMRCTSSWNAVLNAARITAEKSPLPDTHIVSDKFKREMCLSEHSPLRLLQFEFDIIGVKSWVSVHLCRHHNGIEKFVSTQREDRKALAKDYKTRDDIPQGQLVNMHIWANAQALINISRKRLCGRASKETRIVWQQVIAELEKIDPILAHFCKPECIYRGFCPEKESCGYVNSEDFIPHLTYYRKEVQELIYSDEVVYGEK